MKFLKKLCIVTIVFCFGTETFAEEWNVSVWGKRRAFTEHIEKLAELVSEKTNGEFTMNISYGGLSKNKENLDGISIGAFEMAQFCAGYHRDKNRVVTVLELPFLGVETLEQEVAVSSAVYAHPAATKEMEQWNAKLLMTSPMPQYNLVGIPDILADLEGVRRDPNGNFERNGSSIPNVGFDVGEALEVPFDTGELEDGIRELTEKILENNIVTTEIGKAKLQWNEIPLSEKLDTKNLNIKIIDSNNKEHSGGTAVNVGNPHIVFFVNEIENFNIEKIGPEIENHKIFPEKCNVTIATIINKNLIRVKVWERGAGLTKACGTAACATAFAGKLNDLTENKTDIEFQTGKLSILIDDKNSIHMKGPVSEIKEIEFKL